ncbi:hypothetical protein HRL69_002120 [Salmonella enterica]|nr:hypothetical protein [Salmonella enterica]
MDEDIIRLSPLMYKHINKLAYPTFILLEDAGDTMTAFTHLSQIPENPHHTRLFSVFDV